MLRDLACNQSCIKSCIKSLPFSSAIFHLFIEHAFFSMIYFCLLERNMFSLCKRLAMILPIMQNFSFKDLTTCYCHGGLYWKKSECQTNVINKIIPKVESLTIKSAPTFPKQKLVCNSQSLTLNCE